MEPDLQITIKGVQEDHATNVGNAVLQLVNILDNDLDFRRMHQIIIATDFAKEMEEQSARTVSGNAIEFTNEEYAAAVAKVMIFPDNDDFEILPILNAQVVSVLVQQNERGYSSDEFHMALHLVHHELCHVHDDNKKIDVFRDIMPRHRYEGKDKYTYPLAEMCWSEYIANFLSCSTVKQVSIIAMGESFLDAIVRTKDTIDKEIISYRHHGDLNHLMDIFQRHGTFLVKMAAYMLGYMDGLEKTLDELYQDASQQLAGSYFEKTWNLMQETLREMHAIYPSGWKDLSIYDRLVRVVESYYDDMGLILSTVDGEAYVNIPFRPENTPTGKN